MNSYTADYTSTPDGALTFSDIASTAMAGDDAAMRAEADYLAALKTVTGYSISGGVLYLIGGPYQRSALSGGVHPHRSAESWSSTTTGAHFPRWQRR